PFLACNTERQFQIEEVRGLGTGTAGRLLAQADEVAGMEARVAYRQVQALTQRLAQAQVRPVTEEAPAAATRVAVAGRAGQEVVEAVAAAGQPIGAVAGVDAQRRVRLQFQS